MGEREGGRERGERGMVEEWGWNKGKESGEGVREVHV